MLVKRIYSFVYKICRKPRMSFSLCSFSLNSHVRKEVGVRVFSNDEKLDDGS